MSRFSGLRHTEESKEKMRRASMGNIYGLGYRHTEEARAKMSLTQNKVLERIADFVNN